MIPGFNDDPHGAWTNGTAMVSQRANNLATTLDAFYRDLSTSSEMRCGRGGNPLSLADNVVMMVTGDTPKNSFDTLGWPDGTPGNANWVYVRSNGFTRIGWFGQVQPGLRTNFDPITGVLSAGATVASSTGAAFAGTLYAIARGDAGAIAPFTAVPYGGVIRSESD
jgi:hypothetical protein